MRAAQPAFWRMRLRWTGTALVKQSASRRLREVVGVGAYPYPRLRKTGDLQSAAQLQALLQVHGVLHLLLVRRTVLVDQPLYRPIQAGLIALEDAGLRQERIRQAPEQGRDPVGVNHVGH